MPTKSSASPAKKKSSPKAASAKRTAPTKKKAPAKKTKASPSSASGKKSAPSSSKKSAPSKKPATRKAKTTKAGDELVTIDRRKPQGSGEPEPTLPLVERRKKVQRRRQIDPTTCERDYSGDEVEFMNAMDEYKRKSGRMFPTCSEVLEVIRGLGYIKLTPAEQAAVAATGEPEAEPSFATGEYDPNSPEETGEQQPQDAYGELVGATETV